MDLDAYIAEHDGEWRRLAQLSRRRRLTAPEADELMMLYQRSSTQLSMVRSRMPDPLLVARLSGLVLHARSTVTGGRTASARDFVRFFTHMFPAAVYGARRWWAAVAAVFVLVSALIMSYIASNPEVQSELASPDEIAFLVDYSFEQYYSEFQNQNFALQVWTNNARLSALALVGGALLVPTLWVLWSNAIGLSVVGGLMIGNGRADLYFLLIAPHGLLEISSFLLASAIGLRLGWSWIAPPENLTRGQSLAKAGRVGIVAALGLVAVFAVAGLIEGFVTPNLPAFAAVPIGVLAFGGFVAYVVVRGRAAVAEGYTGDLQADMREADLPGATR
ncbi:MAG: stage II sporulation protein M [Stackebrandtia sp.]